LQDCEGVPEAMISDFLFNASGFYPSFEWFGNPSRVWQIFKYQLLRITAFTAEL
jgi:hypothetical protein